jgi:transposase
LPLVFHLTGGEAADCTAYKDLMALADDQPNAFLADKGYDSDAIRGDLKERHIKPVIPPRSNRKKTIRYNKKLYKERNRIERLFGHLKMQRAVATRFDKLARSFLDTLHLATIERCLRYATL